MMMIRRFLILVKEHLRERHLTILKIWINIYIDPFMTEIFLLVVIGFLINYFILLLWAKYVIGVYYDIHVITLLYFFAGLFLWFLGYLWFLLKKPVCSCISFCLLKIKAFLNYINIHVFDVFLVSLEDKIRRWRAS